MTDERPKALRLFIGVRISLATVRALDEAVQVMRRGPRGELRWVAPASYHVTLKFLGWSRPEVAFALRDRVAAAVAGQRAFDLDTVGLGAFPTPARARVLWAGVDAQGGARLAELAGRMERACEDLGFAREERPFHPHVTLARLKVPGDVRGLISGCSEQVFRSSWIDSVVLFESHTKSTGSEYEEKARWSLEGDSKAARRHTGPVETEAELADELPLDEASVEDLMPEPAPEGATHTVPTHTVSRGASHDGPHDDDDEEHHDDGDQFEGPGS
ncbi:MAG TPA: RNA 2',3'-cyclic phosphodiesterase [Kofleriaceae bacterium]|nr:RNA 2',3'-cyclic phosphodiesterase [Kofleriaceae bacterium]